MVNPDRPKIDLVLSSVPYISILWMESDMHLGWPWKSHVWMLGWERSYGEEKLKMPPRKSLVGRHCLKNQSWYVFKVKYYPFYFWRSPSSTRCMYPIQIPMFVARRPLLWVLQWLVRLESALTSSLSPLQRFLVKISLQEIFVVCYTQLWQWWLAKALDFQSEFTPVFLLNVIALQKTYDRSPRRFSGAQRGAVIRYEKTAAFFSQLWQDDCGEEGSC